MKLLVACLVSALLAGFAVPAGAQAAGKAARKVDHPVERARKRCEENRGVDCSSPESIREWMILDRPTAAQRRSAAAARRLRESQAR